MTAMTIAIPDDASIMRMFTKYVEGFDSKPRHSKAANREVDLFDSYVNGACPGNFKLQDGLCHRMMNVAVEFEQCGFIAGVKYALQYICNPEETTIIDSAVEKDAPVAAQEPEAATWSITSKQIAEMFETPNSKVVRRIEGKILPDLDAQSKLNFKREIGCTAQKKEYVYYRLNKAACEIYMAAMEPHKKYVNIAGGLSKMAELMKTVFQADGGKENKGTELTASGK